MQAIQTKYLPATNVRGSRIKATCERGSITIPYPHDLSGEWVHRRAADELIGRFCEEDSRKYGTGTGSNPWNRPYVSGGLPDGSYAHVFVNDAEETARFDVEKLVRTGVWTNPSH